MRLCGGAGVRLCGCAVARPPDPRHHGPTYVRAHKTTCFHAPTYARAHKTPRSTKPRVFTVPRTPGPIKSHVFTLQHNARAHTITCFHAPTYLTDRQTINGIALGLRALHGVVEALASGDQDASDTLTQLALALLVPNAPTCGSASR